MGIDLTDFGAHFTLLLIFIPLHRMVTLGLEFRLMFELQARIGPLSCGQPYSCVVLRALLVFSPQTFSLCF
jgi:hypothetical protein